MTKKARSTGASEGGEAGARAHPRAKLQRAPCSGARSQNPALHPRGPRWGLGASSLRPGSPDLEEERSTGDIPLTREEAKGGDGKVLSLQPTSWQLSEDEQESFVQVVDYFSEGLADTCTPDLPPKN